MPAEQWLSFILNDYAWYPETIALFLRRQGKAGLPIQNLYGCLHKAIYGTCFAHQHELRGALVLLVSRGADVYARDDLGRTVSEIACCKKTKYYVTYGKRTVNRDLCLKEIWMYALSVCGYDPEEVISASVRVEELSDSDTDSSSDQWEVASTAASDCSQEDTDSTSDEEGESDVSAEDVIARQPDAVTPHHYESFLLEGDAEVWNS